MRKLILLFLLVGLPVMAQTHSFTLKPGDLFGYYITNYRNSQPQPTPAPCITPNVTCGVGITGWDGVECPENPLCTYDGTAEAGQLQITSQPTVAGLILPQPLGYPNNGFLPQDCTLVYGPINRTKGNGLNVGDTWSYSGDATCTGYATGVSFTVTTNWEVTSISYHSGRGGPSKTYIYTLESGSGTVTGPAE